MAKFTLAVLTLPTYLIGYLSALLAWALFIAHRPKAVDGVIFMTQRSWVAKFWRFSTTIGKLVLVNPRHLGSRRIREHELVHTRQFEDMSIAILIVTIAANWVPLWCLWLIGPVFLGSSYVASMLRNGWSSAYREAETERSAYSQTEHLRQVDRLL